MTTRPGDIAKAHRLLSPRVAYLIGTYSPSGEPNLIPVSNVTSISTDPQLIVIAVLKRWRTYENLRSAQGFTLSVPAIEQLDGVWKLGARYSGYDFSDRRTKLAECGLTLDLDVSRYGPVLTDGLGSLACQITDHVEMIGDHGVIVGQVEQATFNEAYFDADRVPLSGAHPVMQITGNRFTTTGPAVTIPYAT